MFKFLLRQILLLLRATNVSRGYWPVGILWRLWDVLTFGRRTVNWRL